MAYQGRGGPGTFHEEHPLQDFPAGGVSDECFQITNRANQAVLRCIMKMNQETPCSTVRMRHTMPHSMRTTTQSAITPRSTVRVRPTKAIQLLFHHITDLIMETMERIQVLQDSKAQQQHLVFQEEELRLHMPEVRPVPRKHGGRGKCLQHR